MAAAEPILRAATDGDAAALATLAAQLGYDVAAADVVTRLASLRGHGGEVIVACAEDGRVLGWMGLRIHVSLTTPAQGEIASLVVDASERGRGHGHRLLVEADAWARANGLAGVRVLSNTLRHDAHRFYEREGFARIKTQQLFSRRTDPA